MDELRREFEEMIEAKQHLDDCSFSKSSNRYVSKTLFAHGKASYLNGAWWMFQELKKNED